MNTRQMYLAKVATAFGLSLLFTLLLVFTATAADREWPVSQEDDPYRVEEFDISSPGELEVQTSGGHITVEASENNRVRVEMYVRRNGRDLTPSDTDLDDFDIEISQTGNRVTAIADRRGRSRNWGRNNISISFVVFTPRAISAELRTSGGHIAVTGLDGEQRLSTSGGHLKMNNLKGTVSARTSGGHIEIRDFVGDMNARTSGGHIEVEHSEGTIELHTSGGHISLNQLSGQVEATTSGGSIEADLTSIEPRGFGANLRTSGGHINVTVPEGIGLDLDLKGNRVSTKLENFSGEIERDEVEGSINGGGPKLTARTSGGTVRISFR
ncbi:MAG: DUF4097 family beta strand repeat-containing protein [Balneolaceae bacterium]|nr:DUF4097 family beta strand repeat-containing protein [Balneolaceae bacterium]